MFQRIHYYLNKITLYVRFKSLSYNIRFIIDLLMWILVRVIIEGHILHKRKNLNIYEKKRLFSVTNILYVYRCEIFTEQFLDRHHVKWLLSNTKVHIICLWSNY